MSSDGKPAFWNEYQGEPLPEEDVEELIQVSRGAQDPHVALEYAQRAADSHPDHPQVQESLQRSIFMRLNQDAFVAFVAESTQDYVIRFRNSRPVMVPKTRTHEELFPSLKQTEGEKVLGMIWWILLGLVPAGVVALFLSPLVVYRALYVLTQRGMDRRDRRMAFITILLAGLLGLLGAFFTFLLVLHLIG